MNVTITLTEQEFQDLKELVERGIDDVEAYIEGGAWVDDLTKEETAEIYRLANEGHNALQRAINDFKRTPS